MAAKNPDEPKKEEEVKIFTCSICRLSEKYHFYGSQPSLAKDLRLTEDSYIMKNPFQPRNSKTPLNFLILGSNCSLCENSVCVDSACSIYYAKRFCRNCALEKIDRFPDEIQKELEKMRSMKAE